MAPRGSPATEQVKPDDVQDPPSDEVAVYKVMDDPPLLAGADHETVTVVVAPTNPAETAVGAPGTVGGGGSVTGLDAADAALSPAAFVATTVKV